MVSTSECFAHLEGDADLGNPELQQQQQIHTDKYWSMTVHVRLQQHFKRPHVIVGRWEGRGKGNQLFRICYVNVSSCVLLLECMRHDHKWCLTVLGASWFYESNEPVQNWYCFPRAGNIRQRPGQTGTAEWLGLGISSSPTAGAAFAVYWTCSTALQAAVSPCRRSILNHKTREMLLSKKWILNILKLQLRNLCFWKTVLRALQQLVGEDSGTAPVPPRAAVSVSLQRWWPQPRHPVKHPCIFCTGVVSLLHSSDIWAISSEKKAPEGPEAKVTLSVIVQNFPPLFFFPAVPAHCSQQMHATVMYQIITHSSSVVQG